MVFAHRCPMGNNPLPRRHWLLRAGGGFGGVALSALLQEQHLTCAQAEQPVPRPQRVGGARSVIFLFMDGGPSHLDTFNRCPAINEFAGQPLPGSIKRVITPMGVSENPILPCQRTWKRYGDCGLEVSDWYAQTAHHADDLCVIRSCVSDALNHVGGVTQMNTGTILGGRPSLGAWVDYGLSTENRNLPAFVVLNDTDRDPPGGNRQWGTGFMPAAYQGVKFLPGKNPILHLHPPADISELRQRRKLAFVDQLNQERQLAVGSDSEFDARIASYELAFRMQVHAPSAINLAEETAETQELYGLDQPATKAFGRNCLLARRLVERGVRFVQLYSGSGSRWDAHTDLEKNHSGLCAASDRPIAGLLTDLKRRGLLEETLVIWGGEFGRTPMSEKGDGRDHNPYGFTMWLAGGGVKGGQVIGATDEFGMHAVQDRVHVHDLHATILAALGLDHTQLIFPHQGRPERPTVNEGMVMEQVFG